MAHNPEISTFGNNWRHGRLALVSGGSKPPSSKEGELLPVHSHPNLEHSPSHSTSPIQEEWIGPAPQRKHLACLNPLQITHFFKNYFQVSGRTPKMREIWKKGKKKKGVFFFHPLAPSCSSGINTLLLEPWLTPAFKGQHGPVHRELKIHLGKFNAIRGNCTLICSFTQHWSTEDLLWSRHWERHRRLCHALRCEDQPKRGDKQINKWMLRWWKLGVQWEHKGFARFRDQGRFSGMMLTICVWWTNRS